jgi:hypothetical protein
MSLALVVAAAFVLGIEWRLFESSVREHLLGTFPRFHDQNGYLELAYLGYERIHESGIWNAVVDRLSRPKAQGSLFEIEGAVGKVSDTGGFSSLRVEFEPASNRSPRPGNSNWLPATGRFTTAAAPIGS